MNFHVQHFSFYPFLIILEHLYEIRSSLEFENKPTNLKFGPVLRIIVPRFYQTHRPLVESLKFGKRVEMHGHFESVLRLENF